MPANSPTFFLIDAHGFLHRNYHALPKLSTSGGLEVGALYGFARWLSKMLQEKNPAYVAVCFDSKGGCARRKRLLPAYKANRKKPDDALVTQLDLARGMVQDMGLAVVAQEGIEADDLMAFLALQAQKQQIPSVLVTSDKDVYQFLSDYISVWPSGGKDGIKGPQAAVDKFGVEHNFLPDYFSIVGDASDNVPGVAGVGPKSAVELIKTFGHLEDILRAAQQDDPHMKPALAKKLREQQGNALLSKQLVVLDPELNMPFSLENYRVQAPDPAKFTAMCERYEFKNLFHFSPAAAQAVPENSLFTAAQTKASSLQRILEQASAGLPITLYVEDEHLLCSLSAERYACKAVAEIKPWELAKIKELVFQDNILKIGYDLKFTLRELAINLDGKTPTCFDERLARYMLDPSGDLSPAGTIAHYFSALNSPEDILERMAFYNTYFYQLKDKLEAELKAKQMWQLYHTLELPLMTVLADMEYTGMKVDCAWLESFKILLEKEMAALQTSIDQTAGAPVNIN